MYSRNNPKNNEYIEELLMKNKYEYQGQFKSTLTNAKNNH